ncbi:TonB-dependent siderophore receptor [Roseibium algae]|uniref:TonB-dependent siderophore receptor n=1 Tax=Roseibium algae TaxID=3123038 RepID=A0ABU8TS16_9HYPH
MSLCIPHRLVQITSVSALALWAGTGLAQEQATPLKQITVEAGEATQSTEGGIFESTVVSATKTGTSVLETPQSVTSVTRLQLDEQSPQTVSEALRYTAGVLSDKDTNSRYDSIFLRGFGNFGTSTSYVNFLDGLKLPRGQAFAQTSIDPYLLDRIDVLKGPSALLYGQTNPGGLVNQISRQPSATTSNEVWIQGGSHGRVQGGLSSNGNLTKDGTFQYGLSAVGRLSGTRYDDVDESRIALAPSITWTPDDDTTLTVSGYYQHDPEGGYFNSLYPDFLAPTVYQSYLNRDLNIGDPDFDAFKRTETGIGYNFEHRFNEAFTVRSKTRYSYVDLDFQSLQMLSGVTSAGLIPRQALRSIEDVGGVSTDNQVEFNFQTGPVEHMLLTGIDFQYAESSWQYLWGMGPSLDVTNPVYGQDIGALTTIIDTDQDFWQTGIYAQDQLSIGGFHALLGVRHDWTELSSKNNLTSTTTNQSDSQNSYRAGLLYLFDNGLAPYASYSTSFEPNTNVDANGNPFDPTTAQQFEVGLKYQPTWIDALFTISAFDIRQQDVVKYDASALAYVQQDEVHSRGIEFEARGNMTKNLEVIGALTLLDTEVSKSSVTDNVGKRPQAVPDYYGSLWANYNFDTGALNGLSVGGGGRFVGSSYADDANTIKVDGYTLFDAALRYDLGTRVPKLDGLQVTLNVTNLFDTDYYSSCSSNFYCQYGNGRLVLAGLKYKW